MNRLLFLILIVTFYTCVSAAGEYNVKNIPPGLRKELDVVVRKNIQEFYVLSNERADYYITTAITIFSRSAQSYGDLEFYYSKSMQIDDIEGCIFDSDGEEIYELDSDDIKDYSGSENELASDYRIKKFSLHHNVFPYTIEIKIKYSFDGYLGWPSWFSRNTHAAVQESRFIAKVPSRYSFRYWCSSDKVSPSIANEGKNTIYTFQAFNLKEIPRDAVGADIRDYSDYVLTAPGEFVLFGEHGSMETWKDFGLWNYKLYSSEQDLPGNAVEEIKKQYNSSDDVYTKIKKLYRFMQSRTRYISIQLGIGGWQPLSASFVHEKGYGDCKALSNYMTTILNTAGIEAYPALIYSSDYSFSVEEFPSGQFNHVIVCVPLPEDTIWLECTSQSMPFNKLGWHNENRMALVIYPEGGKIVHTPASFPADNFQLKNSEVKIGTNGDAELSMSITWTGNQRYYNYNIFAAASGNDRIRKLVAFVDVPDINLKHFNFPDEKLYSDTLHLELEADLANYTTVSKNRLFFRPNVTGAVKNIPKDVSSRIAPERYKYSFADADTTLFIIPEGYEIESLPGKTDLQNSFGRYYAELRYSEGKIYYYRYFEINKSEIPAADYNEYRKFLIDMAKSDRDQVVLVQKK